MKLPPGFSLIRQTRTLIAVRDGYREPLMTMNVADPEGMIVTGPVLRWYEGRGRPAVLPLKGSERGECIVVRHYTHGGALRHLTGDVYFTWPPRAFRELAASETARQRGLKTPPVLAAVVRKTLEFLYRCDLVTLEIPSCRDGWHFFSDLADQPGSTDRRRAAARLLGSAVRHIHDIGLYHDDLNLKNLAIRTGEGGVQEVVVFDLDKAQLSKDVSPQRRRRNILRLNRSIEKFNRRRKILDRDDKVAFLLAYYHDHPDPEQVIREYREAL